MQEKFVAMGIIVIFVFVVLSFVKRTKVRRNLERLLIGHARSGKFIKAFHLPPRAYFGYDPHVPNRGRVYIAIYEHGWVFTVGLKGVFHPFETLREIEVMTYDQVMAHQEVKALLEKKKLSRQVKARLSQGTFSYLHLSIKDKTYHVLFMGAKGQRMMIELGQALLKHNEKMKRRR